MDLSHPHAELFALVNDLRSQHDDHYLATCIQNCHNGKLDGRIVTNDNLHLFRRFRNDVNLGSGSAVEMLDKARVWASPES